MSVQLTQRSGFPLMLAAAILFVAGGLAVWLVFDPFGGDVREAGGGVESMANREPTVPSAQPAPGETSEVQPEERTTSAETGPDQTESTEEAAADVGTEKRPAPDEPSHAQEVLPTEAAESESVDTDQPVTGEETEQVADDRVSDRTAYPPGEHVVRTGDTLFDIAGVLWGDPYVWPLLLLENESSVMDPDFLAPGQRIQVPEYLGPPLSGAETETIARAHLLAYARYRELGIASSSAAATRRLGAIRINKSLWVLYSGLRYDHGLLDRIRDDIRVEDLRMVEGFVTRFGYPPDP
jgi:hypothetical protein